MFRSLTGYLLVTIHGIISTGSVDFVIKLTICNELVCKRNACCSVDCKPQ